MEEGLCQGMLMGLMGCTLGELVLVGNRKGVIPALAEALDDIVGELQAMLQQKLEMQILKFMLWICNRMGVMGSARRVSNLTLQVGKSVDSVSQGILVDE